MMCVFVNVNNCPGCRTTCRRSTVATHLQECNFAFEIAGSIPIGQQPSPPSESAEKLSSVCNNNEIIDSNYEVVCVYAKFGCKYTGLLEDVKEHILTCSLRGEEKKEEDGDREAMKRRQVMLDCEEERNRQLHSPSYRTKLAMRGVRVSSNVNGEGKEPLGPGDCLLNTEDANEQYDNNGKDDNDEADERRHFLNTLTLYQDVCNNIHNVVAVQMKSVRQMIHDQAMSLWVYLYVYICMYVFMLICSFMYT